MMNAWKGPGTLVVLIASILGSTALAQNAAIPDLGLEPGQSAFRDPDSSIGLEQIDPFTGILKIVNTDLVVPSNGGLDIAITRSYNAGSKPNQVVPGAFGRTTTGIGWDIHFGRIWRGSSLLGRNNCTTFAANTSNNPVLELPDGSREVLVSGDAGKPYQYITRNQWIAKCLPSSHTSLYGLLVVSPDGVEYTFDWLQKADDISPEAFHVTRIRHPNGTTLTIAYQPKTALPARIDTVTHSEGQVVSFEYDTLLSGSNPVGYLLREIQLNSPIRTWTYNYSTAISAVGGANYYYLDSVERPNGTTIEYDYYPSSPTNGHHLRMITTPMGGTVEYTYKQQAFPVRDNSKYGYTLVVGTKQTGGTIDSGGTWTYNYSESSATKENTTTVQGPNNCVTYVHQSGLINNNARWRLGLLLSKSIAPTCGGSPLRSETYTWTNLALATQGLWNPTFPAADAPAYFPALQELEISQDGTTYTTTNSNFDEWGNARHIVEQGQDTRTIDRTFLTNTSLWIVNRLDDETIQSAGTVYPDSNPSGGGSVVDHVTSRTFHANGDLSTVTVAGVPTTFVWWNNTDSRGELYRVTDAAGKMWEYQNYVRGTAQLEKSPIVGIEIDRTVNPTGTIASVTDGENKTTSFGYDDNNELSSVTTFKTTDDNTTITHTGSPGPAERYRVATRGTLVQTRKYDGFGRLQQISARDTATNQVVTQTFFRDADGRVTRSYLPNSTTDYEQTSYDALNRPRVITHDDGTTVQNEYLSGNRIEVTNERNFRTTYTHRSYGDPSQKDLMRIDARAGLAPADATTITTLITRNRLGQVTSVNQGGLTRSYRYNNRFFLTYEDDPELGTIMYGRNAVGEMTTRTVGSSGTTTFVLDDLYRVDDVIYPANGSQPSFTVDFEYMRNNLLHSVTRGAIRWEYKYDANNNLTNETLGFGGSPTYSLVRGYDTRDALASLTYPSNRQVQFSPNAFGQPTSVTSADATYASNISYYPNGQLNGFTQGNGLVTSFGQNTRLRPTTLTTSAGGTSVINLSYQYDGAGNTSSITDFRDGTKSKTLTYDGVNRLRTASGPFGVGGALASGSFTYDDANNIRTRSLAPHSFTYNYSTTTGRLENITGSTPMTFAYDVYGNITSTAGRSAPAYDTFAYDSGSNLMQVGSPATVTYQYDGNNRMVLETRADGSATRYSVYSGNQRLYDYDSVSGERNEYVYLGARLLARRSSCAWTGGDSDADGIPNCFESLSGLDPNSAADAAQDADGDGATNLAEYQAGTNIGVADTDGDGITDGYELRYGLMALGNDAAGDLDSDGLTNLQEFGLGTAANDADTDNDGIPDGTDPNPKFNPAVLMPILQMLLE